MRFCNRFSLFLFTFWICNIYAESNPSTIDDLLNDVTTDKDHHNLVDDIAHFVVTKVEEATHAVGAEGIVNPGKLQEFVTSSLEQGTLWVVDKTASLYEKIRDRVSQWWSGNQTKATVGQKEMTEEVERELVKRILAKIEAELRSKNVTGDEKDIEKWVMPLVRKMFGNLFGISVKSEEQ